MQQFGDNRHARTHRRNVPPASVPPPAPGLPSGCEIQAASAFFVAESGALSDKIKNVRGLHIKLDEFLDRVISWMRDPNLRTSGTYGERARLHEQIELTKQRIGPERELRIDVAAEITGDSRARIAALAAEQEKTIRADIAAATQRLSIAEDIDRRVFDFLCRVRDECITHFSAGRARNPGLPPKFFASFEAHRDAYIKRALATTCAEQAGDLVGGDFIWIAKNYMIERQRMEALVKLYQSNRSPELERIASREMYETIIFPAPLGADQVSLHFVLTQLLPHDPPAAQWALVVDALETYFRDRVERALAGKG